MWHATLTINLHDTEIETEIVGNTLPHLLIQAQTEIEEYTAASLFVLIIVRPVR